MWLFYSQINIFKYLFVLSQKKDGFIQKTDDFMRLSQRMGFDLLIQSIDG
jgi:hypothetical protein